jgi:hypothetical protein
MQLYSHLLQTHGLFQVRHVSIRHLETVHKPSVYCVMRFMELLYHKRQHRHIGTEPHAS